jgi:NADH:ubiquinone oxidoreductase subunit F (NADH-binding)
LKFRWEQHSRNHFDIGGGIRNGKKFKAHKSADLQADADRRTFGSCMDYDSLIQAGAMSVQADLLL